MFTSDSIPQFTQPASKDELSMSDIQSLLGQKRVESDQLTFDFKDSDVRELEEFCQKHGIVGFNCGNMNPKAALQILKRKVGVADNVISSLEGQGYTSPNSTSNKQLLNG